jgi:hypothetical protein
MNRDPCLVLARSRPPSFDLARLFSRLTSLLLRIYAFQTVSSPEEGAMRVRWSWRGTGDSNVRLTTLSQGPEESDLRVLVGIEI